MRKQVFGRQLKRDTNERKALFRGLASSLVMHERIETTEEKAKAVKGYVEKLVTKAKKHNSEHARRLLEASLSHDALLKLLNDVAPRFADRPGGYTRILKVGNRFSDNASMVYLEWVVRKSAEKMTSSVDVKKKAKKTSEVANEAVISEEPKSKAKQTQVKTKAAPVKKTAAKKTAPAKKAKTEKEKTK